MLFNVSGDSVCSESGRSGRIQPDTAWYDWNTVKAALTFTHSLSMTNARVDLVDLVVNDTNFDLSWNRFTWYKTPTSTLTGRVDVLKSFAIRVIMS